MNIIIVLVAAFSLVCGKPKTFHGDQLITVYPERPDQVKALRGLEDISELADFWNPQYASEVRQDIPVDIRVPRENIDKMIQFLQEFEINWVVKMEDVQVYIDNQVKGRRTSKANGYDYNIYHTYDEILQWTNMIADAYPNFVTHSILGESFEGRSIPMLSIGTNPLNPGILIDCGFHAREWISPAFCQCYVRNLLENYGTDLTVTAQMDRLNFYIVPIFNPDGYVFSWTDNRMWRKTRSTEDDSECIGVDPNRNFDAGWGGPGSSNVSCSATYHGPYPESEIEVSALAEFMRNNVGKITTYVTLHSYSQVILYPYAYQEVSPPNAEELDKYAKEAADAINSVYGKTYGYGATYEELYLAAGGSDDYAYDTGMCLSYTVELRDRGRYGFLLPEDQIHPTCVETTEAMKVFANGAIDLAYNS